MKLNFKFYPIEAKSQRTLDLERNLIILHGLFGSSKNWVSVSKQLSQHFNVYSVDLRNHGDSPHSKEHSIQAMSSDIENFIKEHGLKNVWLLGHSMGGLVSMYFDLTHPNLLESIVIQDISPRTYPFAYGKEIEAMTVDLSGAKSRADVDVLMREFVPDTFIRQFLQMNLERSSEGKYFWKLNVEGIGNSRNLFLDSFQDLKPSPTPALFILGGDSEYIVESDRTHINYFYSNAIIKTIPGGGHYIHFTHANEFMKIVEDFINSKQK